MRQRFLLATRGVHDALPPMSEFPNRVSALARQGTAAVATSSPGRGLGRQASVWCIQTFGLDVRPPIGLDVDLDGLQRLPNDAGATLGKPHHSPALPVRDHAENLHRARQHLSEHDGAEAAPCSLWSMRAWRAETRVGSSSGRGRVLDDVLPPSIRKITDVEPHGKRVPLGRNFVGVLVDEPELEPPERSWRRANVRWRPVTRDGGRPRLRR